MANLLLVAYFFPPTGGAGVQRALKLVEHLPAEGFLPSVVTGPASPDDHWAPEDRTLVESIPPDTRVHRVSGMPPREVRWRRRLERWGLVPGAFDRWWIRSALEAADGVHGQDVILATMSPFSSGIVASRLSRSLGVPWVADLRDPWALDEMQVYPSWLHRRRERRRMERLLSTAALVVMNTPEAARALTEELPRLRGRPVVVVTNGFDRSDFDEPLPDRTDGLFRIVHTGYLHADAGVRRVQRLLGGARGDVEILTRSHTHLLEALEVWCSERPGVARRVELVLAGKTTERDRELVAQSGVASLVRFEGFMPHRESVRLVRGADLLFLPMHNLPEGVRSRIVPGKTYEYMAAGRPILAAVPDGDARDFLRACGTALVCRPDDVRGMVRSLDHAYDRWMAHEPVGELDENFLARFERRHLTAVLADAVRRVLPANERGSAVAPGRRVGGDGTGSLSRARSR